MCKKSFTNDDFVNNHVVNASQMNAFICRVTRVFANVWLITAVFTKPPVEPFLALPGTIPENAVKLSMGNRGRTVDGGFVNTAVMRIHILSKRYFFPVEAVYYVKLKLLMF